MIISHKYKIIYIKNHKCAGESFEAALIKHLALTDYHTRIRRTQNCMNERDMCRFYLVSLCNPSFSAHANADDIKDKISPKMWDNYFKIASIRCPYDTVVSSYFFTKRYPITRNEFEDFILSYKGSQKTWPAFLFNPMHLDGKIAADFLIRYEHLDEDIKKLENKINCPGLLSIFKNIRLHDNIRPKGNAPWIVYSKYPKAKLALDEMLYKQQDNYEFVRKYWPMYKTTLEKNIAQYERGDMNTKV